MSPIRYRLLALSAIPAALLPLAATAVAPNPASLALAFWALALCLYALAAAGACAAALGFERGDHLRRAWGLVGLSYLALVCSRVAGGVNLEGLGVAADGDGPWKSAFGVASSILVMGGAWLLARTWQRTGLALPGSGARRLVLTSALAALAAALAGPDLADNLLPALRLDLHALDHVLSDVADAALLLLVAPLLFTSLALRGGLLRWPWALLAAGTFAWLCYDAASVVGEAAGLSPLAIRLGDEVLRSIACALVLAAGLAQRWAVTGPAAGAPSTAGAT